MLSTSIDKIMIFWFLNMMCIILSTIFLFFLFTKKKQILNYYYTFLNCLSSVNYAKGENRDLRINTDLSFQPPTM